ncbi:hypothetical protein [Actinoalloteichus caeruleus]|uniref:hypothetical protein n=1 Tax=Actinoalloteichus cyanogriseus TaxID=2893586 RepID=UPI0020A572B3|nr:hypothetical protein [Actinoalloteichus caeruleus]
MPRRRSARRRPAGGRLGRVPRPALPGSGLPAVHEQDHGGERRRPQRTEQAEGAQLRAPGRDRVPGCDHLAEHDQLTGGDTGPFLAFPELGAGEIDHPGHRGVRTGAGLRRHRDGEERARPTQLDVVVADLHVTHDPGGREAFIGTRCRQHRPDQRRGLLLGSVHSREGVAPLRSRLRDGQQHGGDPLLRWNRDRHRGQHPAEQGTQRQGEPPPAGEHPEYLHRVHLRFPYLSCRPGREVGGLPAGTRKSSRAEPALSAPGPG